jgi:hypothetical protein
VNETCGGIGTTFTATCETGSTCANVKEDPGSFGTCLKLSGEGEPCGAGSLRVCKDDFYCDASNVSTTVDHKGVCKALVRVSLRPHN